MITARDRNVRWHGRRPVSGPAVLFLAAGERVCIVCGCTDSRACPGGCTWRIKHKGTNTGVCSRCHHDKGGDK